MQDQQRAYRPSNGTEGELFMQKYCYTCKKDDQKDLFCPLLGDALCFDVDDEEFPKEWTYGLDGLPTCTAYEPNDELFAPVRVSN